MSITDSDGKPGLRIESAASITLRDTVHKHMGVFAHTIRTDRYAGQSVAAAYVDGLAGALALTIAGGHGSRADVVSSITTKLIAAIDRDLRHLGRAT